MTHLHHIHVNVVNVLFLPLCGCINLFQEARKKYNTIVHIVVGERTGAEVEKNHLTQEDTDSVICRRCHRKLKDEESKQLGFGKICYKKYLKRKPNYLFEVNTNEVAKQRNV